jgi:hypothetical protein
VSEFIQFFPASHSRTNAISSLISGHRIRTMPDVENVTEQGIVAVTPQIYFWKVPELILCGETDSPE